MMKALLRAGYIALCCLLAQLSFAPLHAASLSTSEATAARSAFSFAERGKWHDARLHAKRTDDDLARLIEWLYLLDPDSGADIDEIKRFMEKHADWPEQSRLQIRAEQAMFDTPPSSDERIEWFSSRPPITGGGKILLAEALMDSHSPPAEKITTLVREAWHQGTFSEEQERKILALHRGVLRKEDHERRTSNLLFEGNIGAARRMARIVSEDYQSLIEARVALIQDKKNAASLVAGVSSNLKNDPGLMFDRLVYRARRGDDTGVREILLAAPDDIPYEERWWPYRERQAREAISKRNYELAARLLKNHGQKESLSLANALWLKGWLECEFLNNPKGAYGYFYTLYNSVRFPVSRSRAAYWAARAAEKSGDKSSATSWYETASAYPTTFYGQLAAYKHFGKAPLHIPAEPSVDSAAQNEFEKRSVIRAVALAVSVGEIATANRIIGAMIEQTKSDQEAILLAQLGHRIENSHLSVRASKKALQRNLVLKSTGYPLMTFDNESNLEAALILALIRQESEFDPRATSQAGARGLMQLMPGTAKETAKKLSMPYDLSSLYQKDYNIRLGSHYFERLLGAYDGSYLLTIAAYNAGPGNVRKWLASNGNPHNDVDRVVNWIEKIPFAETRSYVQRVLENLQVYRHLHTKNATPQLKIADDLLR